MNIEECSKFVIDRSEKPKFMVENNETHEFHGGERSIISFDYEVKNSNGVINFIGEVDLELVNKPIKWLKYKTNVKGAALAFIDTTVQFCISKNAHTLNSISLREVESYLRDDNVTPSFPDEAISMYRIFDFIQALQDNIAGHLPTSGLSGIEQKESPTFDLYEKFAGTVFNEKIRGPFNKLGFEEKAKLVDEVFDAFIRPPLQQDGGDVECIHIADDMVVINYLGSCGTCSMSLTTTMEFIQNVLRKEFNHSSIQVITDS